MRSLVLKFGHVRYAAVCSPSRAKWRVDYEAKFRQCEMCYQYVIGLGGQRIAKGVFDHCHEHGYVRGMVCVSCNVKLGQLDAARRLPGVTVDRDSPTGRYLAGCPVCGEVPYREGTLPVDEPARPWIPVAVRKAATP